MSRFIFPLLCLAMVSCAPPFLVQLDSSSTLTRQMTTVGTFGSINVSNMATNVRFLPTKPTATSLAGFSVQSGFTIVEDRGYDNLSFAYVDSSGQIQETGSQSFLLSGADPNYPLYEYDVTTTTTSANIVIFKFDPSTPTNSNASIFEATLPSGLLGTAGYTENQLLTGIFTGQSILGESMAPSPYPTPDAFNVLLLSRGPPLAYSDGTVAVGAAPAVLSVSTLPSAQPLLTFPGTNRFLYCVNQGYTLSYASQFTGSGWACYRWTTGVSAAPVLLTDVVHRIDAILTTGDLLSTEGGILRLYDPNGSPVLGVALGGLQFCYEAYVGSTPYVFFSLPMSTQPRRLGL